MAPRYRTLLLLSFGVALVGFWRTSCGAREGWYGQLARHWAPVIFQDIDVSPENQLGRYDFITSAEFDGDQAGGNNWENADDTAMARFPLKPYVYYSVVETRTHYFIAYSLFHPRDWRRSLAAAGGAPPTGDTSPAAASVAAAAALTHENDLESATFVILKDRGWGQLRLVGTVCHLNNYCFIASADIQPEVWALDLGNGDIAVKYYDARPCLFVESGGHGIGGPARALTEDTAGAYAIGSRRYAFRGEAGLIYKCADDPAYAPNGEPAAVEVGLPADSECLYQLIPLATSLWASRESVGAGLMYEDAFNYTSAGGCRLEGLPLFLAADGQDKGANPPWARAAAADGLGRGTWFLDPAYAINHYMASWKDPEREGYWEYVTNEYAAGDARIEMVPPARDRPFVAGYPVQVAWRIASGQTDLAGDASLYVSRSGGRTWTPLPVGVDAAAGEAVWTAAGPASDRCLVALRSPLACDPNVQVSAVSAIFSIAAAPRLEWVRLDGPSQTAPAQRHLAAGIFDARRDRLVVFGGRDSADYNDVWTFGFTDMTWRRVHDGALDAPHQRASHVTVYDPGNDNLVVYGGAGDTPLSDTWLFSLRDETWTEAKVSGADARIGAAGIFDPIENRLLVFGGSDGEAPRNDVRALSLPDEEITAGRAAPGGQEPWVTVNTGTGAAPAARAYAAGVYDADGRRFIVHGGVGGPGGNSPLADTWALSLDTSRWELLHDGSGECPAPRWQHAGIIDNGRGQLGVFGGRDLSATYADVWVLDLKGGTWTQVKGGLDATSPGERAAAAAGFRPSGGQLVIWGGRSEATLPSGVWSMDLGQLPPGGKGESKGLDDTFVAGPNVWPNPTGDDVAIGLSLREPGLVTVGIYDVAGRLVKILNASRMPAGLNIFHWDTRDSRGERVAGGVYFCRMATISSVQSEPVVIAR
jgi:hypothetical protein